MKMSDAVEALFAQFGPEDQTDPAPLVKRIAVAMGDREVPDATYKKVVAIGNLLLKARCPR